MFSPKRRIPSRLPNDSEHIELITKSGHIIISVAARRDRLKRFCTKSIDTSDIDIVLVSAATSSSVKKSIDHHCAPGIWANTSGSVTNTSVVPRSELRSRLKLNTVGKMIIPIITATSVVSSETVTEVDTSLVDFG